MNIRSGIKRCKENIVKDWITSIFGIATMSITLLLVFTKDISFKWDGVIGLAIGCALLLSPKNIFKIIIEGLRAWGNKSSTLNDPNEPSHTEKTE